MQLLIVRHAIALSRETFSATGKDDDLRPLTQDGRRKMRRIAKGLQSLAGHPDVLAASPLTRAQETGQILAEVYGMKLGAPVEALRPEAHFTMFATWTRELDDEATLIAVVGHDPHLSGLVTWLMSGNTEPTVTLKKGGACLLKFDGRVRRSGPVMDWLLTPSQLRQLGD
ncbi:MAG TPA: histidine phosphatase family protein [Gemmatimonadaceae bacterium]|jgi:phosphohistidine phosphatase